MRGNKNIANENKFGDFFNLILLVYLGASTHSVNTWRANLSFKIFILVKNLNDFEIV